VVKGVRGFRLGLCFRSVQRSGPGGGRNRRSANRRRLQIVIFIYVCLYFLLRLENIK
jgi:hypothetical protein